ncbi:MAG: hypothetical protein ABI168_04375 [Ginsengibacter sp.]
MKKYFIPMIAIALIIFASAFTIINKNSHPKPTETTYWFAMDAYGNVTNTQVTDLNNLCPYDGDGCARQYNQSQTEIVSGVRQVKASQVDFEIGSKAKLE